MEGMRLVYLLVLDLLVLGIAAPVTHLFFGNRSNDGE